MPPHLEQQTQGKTTVSAAAFTRFASKIAYPKGQGLSGESARGDTAADLHSAVGFVQCTMMDTS